MGELYDAQPAEPLQWLSDWIATNAPPLSPHEPALSPALPGGRLLADLDAAPHAAALLGEPAFAGAANFRCATAPRGRVFSAGRIRVRYLDLSLNLVSSNMAAHAVHNAREGARGQGGRRKNRSSSGRAGGRAPANAPRQREGCG